MQFMPDMMEAGSEDMIEMIKDVNIDETIAYLENNRSQLKMMGPKELKKFENAKNKERAKYEEAGVDIAKFQ